MKTGEPEMPKQQIKTKHIVHALNSAHLSAIIRHFQCTPWIFLIPASGLVFHRNLKTTFFARLTIVILSYKN